LKIKEVLHQIYYAFDIRSRNLGHGLKINRLHEEEMKFVCTINEEDRIKLKTCTTHNLQVLRKVCQVMDMVVSMTTGETKDKMEKSCDR
jgi:hypothetical protein